MASDIDGAGWSDWQGFRLEGRLREQAIALAGEASVPEIEAAVRQFLVAQHDLDEAIPAKDLQRQLEKIENRAVKLLNALSPAGEKTAAGKRIVQSSSPPLEALDALKAIDLEELRSMLSALARRAAIEHRRAAGSDGRPTEEPRAKLIADLGHIIGSSGQSVQPDASVAKGQPVWPARDFVLALFREAAPQSVTGAKKAITMVWGRARTGRTTA